MNLITKGATDVTRYIMLVDSTAGTPETGYAITDLDLQYTRNRTAPVAKVDAVALAATDTAHTDNRAIQVDATFSPGLYRVDWPDAAFATGVDKVLLVVTGTGLAPTVEEIQLVNVNLEDGVRLGLTALPNAAADAAGGLVISDAGGLDADAQRVDVAAILVDTGTTLDGRLPAALVSGRINASIGALNGSATAAQNLERSASSIYLGSITATSTSTALVDSGLTQSGTDHWKGRIVIFTSGTLAGQATDILAFTPASDTLTVTALTAAPATSDQFVIV